ncbi:hypothetical protein MKX01_026701 [Papaver californicum]|nr:hypothetical protein MKX01_026701 [Papaver californicum]
MASTTSTDTVTTTPPLQSNQQQEGVVVGGGFTNSSLYVGDLDQSVSEGQLYDIFNQVVPVVSVRVCRDQMRRISLGYAYINFNNHQDANTALEVLNFTPINGKPIRIMFSHRDPSIRKSGQANIFIKNLDSSIDNKALFETFAAFGTVLSCKVATDNNTGQSKGYGFVQFERDESAQDAINRLNGMLINDKQVYVGLFVRRQERDLANGSPKFTNVYVKNLSESTTDDDLSKVFGSYGQVTSAVIMRDASGNSRGFGFVNFQNPDDAAAAVEKLNGSTFNDDKVWYVGRAQRKSEREAELKAKFEQERNDAAEKLQGSNLYLKNLDDTINDENLRELFSEFGTITSCKVMLDPQGQSRGSGFVAFSTSEEATKALNEMNGKIIGRKPLYVAVAQRKDDRKARLQAQFSQVRAPVAMAPLPPGIAAYHLGGPRPPHPQQIYFSQGGPSLVPQPAAYGFQPQLLPGMRPGVAPNFMMPYPLQRQGQPGQRMGARRAGNPQQQMQQQQQQHQLMQRNANNHVYRYISSGRNEPAMVPQGFMGQMMSYPSDAAGMPMSPVDAQRPGSVQTLASVLASADPEHQHVMLGEHLFPLVERIEHDQAGKVTGMLLEMDQTEVLHLLEAPEALQKKVEEALSVLGSAKSDPSLDRLASLSLNN